MNRSSRPIAWDEKHWEAEADLDAIARAIAVKKDPKRMEAVKKIAKEKLEENKRRRDAAQGLVDLGEGKTGEA